MKNNFDLQFDTDLSGFSSIKEVSAPKFFYTRLIARMESEKISSELVIKLNPVWVACTFTLFLIINSLIIAKTTFNSKLESNQDIEALAASYDQTISN